MRRRDFLGVLGDHQVLGRGHSFGQEPMGAAFVRRLRKLGWIEGRTVAIEYGWAEGSSERYAEIAAEFVRRKVDVIVTYATPPTIAAKEATAVIPILRSNGGSGRRRAQALYVAGDPHMITNRVRVNTFALVARLPSTYNQREYVEAGGLMSYGPNFPDLFRRAGDYVDKILRGTKAAELPVEQPIKLELVINLKTAKALKLDVPLILQQRRRGD